MRIRQKLLVLIAAPLLLLGIVSAVGFRNQSATIERAEDGGAVTERARRIHQAVLAIGTERLAAAGADVGPVAGSQDPVVATDLALDELGPEQAPDAADGTDTVTTLPDGTVDGPSAEAAAEARTLIEVARTAADDGGRDGAYGAAIAALLDVERATVTDLPSPRTYNQALTARLSVELLDAWDRAWLAYLDQRGPVGPDAVPLSVALSETTVLLETLSVLATDREDPTLTVALGSDSLGRLRELRAAAVNDLGQDEASLVDGEVLDALVAFRAEWSALIAAQDAELVATVTDERAAAEASRSLAFLLAVAGIVTLSALIFVIHRSVADPLEELMERADEVAHRELPQVMHLLRANHPVDDLPEARPIPVTTEDEIGELVTAFNDVQITAFDLAREQAIGRRNVSDMFINLGRRNQQLLQRILSQLSRLEQQEEDPETLRELFELDNAVTRMRRNAESLLALAGARTSRQWSKPVDVENAVRGSLGEVEGYERIDITQLEPASIQGNVVADLTHLLAELLENALNFSEPETMVLVSGHHERGGYHVTIIDSGIGMSTSELADYNARITDPPPLERVPTRFLGLYVVGRLAEAHGISVRLAEAPSRGVMARVELPAELLGAVGPDRDAEPAGRAGMPLVDEALPLRADPDDDTSPLESTHDLDAELTAMLSGELPTRPGTGEPPIPDPPAPPAPSSDLPTRGTSAQLPVRGAEPTTGPDPAPQLPVRGASASATDTDTTGPLPIRGARTGTTPEAGAGALPVRGTTPPATEPEPVEALPVRGRSAETTPQAGAGALPVRGAASPATEPGPVDGGVDGEADGTADERRSGLDQRPTTDNSERSAGDFSSMMSALSSGISRGLNDSKNQTTKAEPDDD